MLQFDVELCCSESNPGGCSNSYTGYYTLQAYKVRRCIHLFVASELVSDIEGYISERTHTAGNV
jgi:hypothetical protein